MQKSGSSQAHAAAVQVVGQSSTDGGSGACPEGPFKVDDATSKYRVGYLILNLCVVLVVMIAGVIVYQATNSLSVMLDWLGGGADAVGVSINIVTELAKRRMSSPRLILILDLAGCLLSVFLLSAVAIIGVLDAIARTEEHQHEHLMHVDQMFAYSSFSVSLSFTLLLIFGCLKSRMFVQSDPSQVRDDLNMLSTLLHITVDFVSNSALLGTAIWLKWFADFHGEPKSVQASHKVFIDACGSFVVCACIVAALALFFQEAMETVEKIQELGEKERAGGDVQVASALSSSERTVKASYGAFEDVEGGHAHRS